MERVSAREMTSGLLSYLAYQAEEGRGQAANRQWTDKGTERCEGRSWQMRSRTY